MSYQRVLRVMGAWLDRQRYEKFRVIEEPGGYSIILESGPGKPTLQLAHFAFDTIETQARELVRGKRVFGRGTTEPWSLVMASREDVLRAIGFELDEVGAKEISIDELQDGLLVTYSYMDPGHGLNWRKRWAVMHGPEISELLRVAHSRRIRRGILGRLRG